MNTNIIKNQLMRVKQSLIALFLLLTLSLNFACVDSPDNMQVISDNPFGVGIIVFNSVPSLIFGNGIDQDTIKINTGLIPDGSSIDARITGTNLESNVAGCVLSGSTNIVNGMGTFNFLSPIFIGNPGQIENVNLAVDIVIPGDDTPDTTVTDFVSLLINAVSITPPGDNNVTPLPLDNPFIQFIDFIFTTTGIPPTAQEPSIVAECMASNPDLGFIDNTQINGNASTTPVLGTTEAGRFITEYFINNGTLGGNQLITCMITLPNPQDIDPGCPNVPLNERKVTAELLVIHNPSEITAPNAVTCTPNPITGGNDGICTCNGTNASGLQICISSPGPDVLIDECGTGDVNGTVTIPFDTNVVPEQVINPVICEIPDGEFFSQTNVTINPGVVNSLTCVPNPVASDIFGGMDTDILCTCATNSPFTQVCFEEVNAVIADDPELDFTSDPDPFCVDTDANGNAIAVPHVDAGVAVNTDVLIECCLDPNEDDNCDDNVTEEFTVNITPFVPPVTSISCTAQSTTLGPDSDTVIDISTTGLVVGIGDVCAVIEINSSAPNDPPSAIMGTGCSLIDANGDASVVFNGATTVAVEQDVTVRCFIDNGATNDMFDAGEVSVFEVITLDPTAGVPPVEIACGGNPTSVFPGFNSTLTGTVMNAAPNQQICWEFFSNTSLPSSLSDDDEPGNVTRVCGDNITNTTFAVFESNATITGPIQNASILCCADINGTPDECDAGDPQDLVVIQVDPGTPPPLEIGIAAFNGNLTPADGDEVDIQVATNPALPAGTTLCLFKVFDNTDDDNDLVSDSGAPVVDGIGETICEQIPDGSGEINNDFRLVVDSSANDGELISVQGCIDQDADDDIDACDPGEPFSNVLIFTVTE